MVAFVPQRLKPVSLPSFDGDGEQRLADEVEQCASRVAIWPDFCSAFIVRRNKNQAVSCLGIPRLGCIAFGRVQRPVVSEAAE